MSYFPTTKIEYSDSPSIDAFARLRVSNTQSLFDSKQIGMDNGLIWSIKTNGAGASTTYNINESSTTLQVGTVSGEYVIR